MIRFMFLRDKKKQTIGCVAIDVTKQGNSLLLTYGLSVLNPLDKFNRTLARNIALGRNRSLDKQDIVYVASMANMHDISKAVMSNLSFNIRAPNRARRAAKLWLTNNDTRQLKEIL